MLEQVLQYLNHWFLMPDGIHEEEYTIKDGSMVLPFLKDGQYFRIFGSVFNDGLHQYPATDLTDETFTGTVWALAVPQKMVSLSEEIKDWVEKNPPSAFTSESFGGYSYTKAAGASGQLVSWQDVFGAQLAPYRKIRETGFVKGQQPIKAYQRPWNPDYPFGGDL